MNETLLPDRFVLNHRQLAAAITLGGLRPSHTSTLPGLPPSPDGLAALAGTNLVTAAGMLTEQAAAVLRAATDPLRMLTVVTNRAGRPAWTETLLAQGAPAGPFALVACSDTEADLALLPTVNQVVTMLDDLLQFTMLPAPPGDTALTLDLTGYAAALAMADVLQVARLGARLARERRPLPVLTPELLEGQLAKGTRTADTRWAVTAAQMAGPADLRPAAGKMAVGLAALQAAGLVGPAGQGFALTDAGFQLADAFTELFNTAAVTMAETAGADRIGVGHVTVYRCTTSIWMATWSGGGAQDARVRLMQVSSASALRFVRALLEPD
jgi:hypothetical protein